MPSLPKKWGKQADDEENRTFDADSEILPWLASLEANATNGKPAFSTNQKVSGTNQKVSGAWVELVKVKKWYSMRLMRWDATNKRKVYVRYIGTLEKCKTDSIYASEAIRLEKRRFGISGGAIIPDSGAYQPNAAEYLH